VGEEKHNTSPIGKDLLLILAPAGCSLFVLTFLIEGALRPNYSALKHPVSSLSIGETGWIQVMNFIGSGFLLLIFSYRLRKRLKPIPLLKKVPVLFGMVALGLIGAGICITDPVYGYPENKPLRLSQFTIRGHLHDVFSLFVFVCLPVACFSLRNYFLLEGKKGLANYVLYGAIGMLLAFIFAGFGFKQIPGIKEFAGLLQRTSIIIGWTIISWVGIYFYSNRDLK
jgi:hypothetical protein